MIALVAVRPNIIVDRQYLSSPQIEPFIFIFCENMTYYSKTIPFLLRLNYILKRHLQKEKTSRVASYRDNRLSALCTDRRLVKTIEMTLSLNVRHNETAMTLPIPSAQRTFGPGRP
jgi:hypothetical protein